MSYESPEGGNESQMPFSIFALFYRALRKKNLYGRVDSVNTLYTLSLLTVRREIIMLFFFTLFLFFCVCENFSANQDCASCFPPFFFISCFPPFFSYFFSCFPPFFFLSCFPPFFPRDVTRLALLDNFLSPVYVK